MNVHQARRFAEKTTTTARDTTKSIAAADEMTQTLGQGYFAAAEAVRVFNMKLIEMAQANTKATLNFAQQAARAKGPSEATALWSSYACERFATLTDQSKQLTALAQNVMTSCAQPLTHAFAQNAPLLREVGSVTRV